MVLRAQIPSVSEVYREGDPHASHEATERKPTGSAHAFRKVKRLVTMLGHPVDPMKTVCRRYHCQTRQGVELFRHSVIILAHPLLFNLRPMRRPNVARVLLAGAVPSGYKLRVNRILKSSERRRICLQIVGDIA